MRYKSLALAVCLLAAAPAMAETAAAPPASAMQQAIEQRIAALKTKLAITPAETNDWNNFAAAMRDNATSTNALFQQRAEKTQSMSAVENMKSYATLARAYADNLDKLSAAFEKLYGELSPEQQKTADALFRQPPAPAEKK
jgi:glucose dehydrogenase